MTKRTLEKIAKSIVDDADHAGGIARVRSTLITELRVALDDRVRGLPGADDHRSETPVVSDLPKLFAACMLDEDAFRLSLQRIAQGSADPVKEARDALSASDKRVTDRAMPTGGTE